MQLPVAKIVRLLTEENAPEVRRSAITILGEVGGRDGEVNSAVIEALTDPDAEVRLRAIRATGQLHLDKAIPQLSERIKNGGPESEAAADAIAALGSKGSATLHDLMPRVAPGLRRYIAAALARSAADGNELDVLTDKDPAVVDAAVNALATMIPTMEPKRRKSLADALIKLAGSKRAKLPPAAEAGVIRLAGLLEDHRIAGLLWDRILPSHPPEVRAQALQALGRFVQSPDKHQRDRLFKSAADASFRVAAPALMILDKIPMTPKLEAEWEPLLRAPDIAVRRVAMTKIGNRDNKDIVSALLEQVHHPDRAYREEVLTRLAKSERGRASLIKLVREAETPDEAWNLTRTLAPLAQANPESWTRELFPTALKYLEDNDRRADPLLFVLREADYGGLRDRLEKRATALVKKGDFETAHLVYRVLARDPAVGFPIRLQIAAAGVKVSRKELESEFRANDPALHQFADLARQDTDMVLDFLSKTKWLGAEELYYVGFHFSEYMTPMKEFGAEVLRILLKRFGRSKLAAAAKNKLKTTG